MDDIDKYILKHWDKPIQVIAEAVHRSYDAIAKRRMSLKTKGLAPKQGETIDESKLVEAAKNRHHQKLDAIDFSRKEKKMVEEIERLEKELEAVKSIKEISTYEIKPKTASGDSEAVAVIVASDWHIEEPVDAEQVSGLNEFSLEIAEKRIKQFWQTSLRMVQIFQKDTRIDTAIVALLGDFFSSNIHEELSEVNELLPIDAVRQAQEHIVSGIEFLLQNSKLNLVVVCHSGNHARVTKKQRHATESGNSLEYLMYHNIALYFRKEKRITFVIPKGYHSYIDALGYTLRFHHGHDLRYAGGVGGLFIPAFKAIAQWDKGRRADCDIFGHWHTRKDGGKFLCNGSLIGFNAFALAIKADFEKPSQLLFLVDKKRGRTITAPIILD